MRKKTKMNKNSTGENLNTFSSQYWDGDKWIPCTTGCLYTYPQYPRIIYEDKTEKALKIAKKLRKIMCPKWDHIDDFLQLVEDIKEEL
jgi:hypothetical protein